jgi:hypothetical protein
MFVYGDRQGIGGWRLALGVLAALAFIFVLCISPTCLVALAPPFFAIAVFLEAEAFATPASLPLSLPPRASSFARAPPLFC